MLEIRIHGYGGQGAVTLAHLLAQAGLNSGAQAQALPSFGVERRGAPVKAAVRISDEPIWMHSQSKEPDLLVLMNADLLERGIAEGLGEKGRALVNSNGTVSAKIPSFWVDANAIATEEGLVSADGPFINIPLYGATLKLVGISIEIAEKTIKDRWSGEIGEKNARAALRGYNEVRE